ncbi:MAG: PAS domain S-box protein [Fibrobacterota bacterium]
METTRLVHKLQAHEIELEMQNEELRQTHAHIETLLAQYADLYDFAPVGYMTLNRKGAIRQLNLTGARLLGIERSRLMNRRFNLFVAEADRYAFSAFLGNVFAGQAKECCEVTLPQQGSQPLVVQIEGTRSADGRECRAALLNITERKKTEASLRESEVKFRNYVERAPDGIFIVDDTGRYIESNTAASRITGYSKQEIEQMSIDGLLAEESLKDGWAHHKKIIDTGAATSDLWHKHKDGSKRCLTVDAVKLSEKRVLGFCKDITERKRAENRLILLNTTLVSLGMDHTENINRMTALCGQLLGGAYALYNRLDQNLLCSLGQWQTPPDYLSEDAPDGHLCYDIIQNPTGQPVFIGNLPGTSYAKSDPNVRKYGLKAYLGHVVRCGDKAVGALCVVFQTDYPPTENDKQILGILAAALGVEESRNESAQALIQSNNEWEETFDIINEAITIHDTRFNIIRSNKASERMLNKNTKEILSLKCFASYHGTTCSPQGCPSCECLKTGKPSMTEIFEPYLNKFLEIKALPRFNKKKELVGLVHVVSDMTRHKHEEAEKATLSAQLIQSHKMEAIGQLAGGVAHDFNNQLSIIQGSAELLKKLVLNDPLQNTYTDMILNAAIHSAELTRQLLLFARKSASERKQVSLHGIIRDVIKILKTTIDRRIKLTSVLESSSDILLGDAMQLHSALLNLALNARDAMPDGGVITFTTQLLLSNPGNPTLPGDGNYIALKIRDTGIGMTPEVKSHLFDPFFTTKAPGKGTGLGLASIYGTVKNHLGSIMVDSESGQGTLFTILLPLHEHGSIEPTVDAAPADSPSGQGFILVLDDEPMICQLVSQFLSSLGYKAETFTDSEDALEYYQAHFQEINIVMLDMNMPKASGQEVFVKFRKIHPEGKVLFASGLFEEKDLRFFQELGVRYYLQKPYTIEVLASKLKEIFENS